MEFQLFDLCESYDHGVPAVILIGRKEDGSRAIVRVVDVPHEIYLAVNENCNDDVRFEWESKLNDALAKSRRSFGACPRTQCPDCPDSCKNDGYMSNEPCAKTPFFDRIVKKSEFVKRRGFFGYEEHPRTFVRFVLCSAHFARSAQKILESFPTDLPENKRGVFNCDPNPVESFMCLKDFHGFQWLSVPANRSVISYRECVGLTREDDVPLKWLTYDIETITPPLRVRLRRTDEEILAAIDPSSENVTVVPISDGTAVWRRPDLKFVSTVKFVYETVKTEGKSDSSTDPIGMISVRASPGRNLVFTWCPRDEDSRIEYGPRQFPYELLRFSCESEMLEAFRKFVVEYDPDVVSGFNSNKFDLRYVLERYPEFANISVLGRTRPLRRTDKMKTTNQAGSVSSAEVDCPGRIFLDVYCAARDGLKLSRYNLQAVAEHFGLGSKGDVSYKDIYSYFYGTSGEKHLLHDYCMQDTILAWDIAERMMLSGSLVAKSKVFRMRARDVLDRGVQYLVTRLIRWIVKDEYLLPVQTKGPEGNIVPCKAYSGVSNYAELAAGESYVGGMVLDMYCGFHEFDILTMDFNSLYPTSIIAGNMCPTTLLNEARTYEGPTWPIDRDAYCYHTGTGNFFVQHKVREGAFPRMFRKLLDARKEAKKKRDTFPKDTATYRAYDALQESYKLAANSGYGGAGSSFSKVSCLPLAHSTTLLGRLALSKVVSLVNDLKYFQKWGGAIFREGPNVTKIELIRRSPDPGIAEILEADPFVVYGDTDSVFVGFRSCTDTLKSRRMAAKLRDTVNEHLGLPHPMKIAAEDIAKRALMMTRKKYAKWIVPAEGDSDDPPKIKHRGMETVRRDGFPALSDVLNRVVDYVFSDEFVTRKDSRNGLAEMVRDSLKEMISGSLPVKKFVMTSNLSKPVEEYADNPPHVEVARRLIEAGYDVQAGNRVEYVYVDRPLAKKKCEQVLGLAFYESGKTKLGYREYLSDAKEPLKRILEHVLGVPVTKRLLDVNTYLAKGMHEYFSSKIDDRTIEAVNERTKPKPKRRRIDKNKFQNATMDDWLN